MTPPFSMIATPNVEVRSIEFIGTTSEYEEIYTLTPYLWTASAQLRLGSMPVV